MPVGAPSATGRTGSVFLEHFDEGMARTIGGELVERVLDGEVTQEYAIAIDRVTGPPQYDGKVPIVFGHPEDAFQEVLLPRIELIRSAPVLATDRWQPGGFDYRVPMERGPKWRLEDGREVAKYVETKEHAWPHDITYDVHLKARTRTQANLMYRQIGVVLGLYPVIHVRDTAGEERTYQAFNESTSGIDELTDISERMIGFTMSVRVAAELDFEEPYVEMTTPRLRTNIHRKD
jgi:hypothetical protein